MNVVFCGCENLGFKNTKSTLRQWQHPSCRGPLPLKLKGKCPLPPFLLGAYAVVFMWFLWALVSCSKVYWDWKILRKTPLLVMPGALRPHCPRPLLTSGLLAAGSQTLQLTFVTSFNVLWDGDSDGALSLMAQMSPVGGWSRAQRWGTSALMNLISSRA